MSEVYSPPKSDELVLSTLNPDGSRRWLRPRVSPGRFLSARRIVGYVLIAIFALLPYIRINGKPAILLDIVHREFTFFGKTFLPTDTVLLAIFMVGVFITIFFLTAVLGRVWCGWACPQTVYMEFVYRPIERFFDGPPRFDGSPGRKRSDVRTVLKYLSFLIVSMFLAHVFLAYFVGIDALVQWVQQSPLEHPISFLVMAATTGAMMFDFCYFREQLCIVACPYGRFQSVMLDRDSLIISYDTARGEPRGKPNKAAGSDERGDCIDCNLCVVTCPTGIDIREGLKMECVACAQCIDACDNVMDKLKKPRGLIRYGSQARIEGERGRLIRPRVIVYPAILLILATIFSFLVVTKSAADVTVLRGRGNPFVLMENGEISNTARVKIVNRSDETATYTIEVADDTPARLVFDEHPITIESGEARTEGVLIIVPRNIFRSGTYDIQLRVSDGAEYQEVITHRLIGPKNTGNPTGESEANDG